MKAEIVEFVFPTEEKPVGHVLYRITLEDRVEFVTQPFMKGTWRYNEAGKPVWGWNGDMEEPSLLPSFFWSLGTETGIVFHCFLTYGRIDLCSDSTVRL